MSIKLATAATAYPLSVAELEAHLKLDEGQDPDVGQKLRAACRNIERAVGYPILHSVWDWETDHWPCELPHHQVSAIGSVKYTAAGAAQATVSSSIYRLVGAYDEAVPEQYVGAARIVLVYGQSWPSVTLETGEPIVIRLTSGWKNPAAVPDDLKTAIFLEAGHLYRNRESVIVDSAAAVDSKPLARGVDHYIAPYVRWKF